MLPRLAIPRRKPPASLVNLKINAKGKTIDRLRKSSPLEDCVMRAGHPTPLPVTLQAAEYEAFRGGE